VDEWDEEFTFITRTTDGGFLACGTTDSFWEQFYEFLAVKLDANGTVQWAKTYGGGTHEDDYDEVLYGCMQTSDGGYLLVGESDTFETYAGDPELWAVKTDANGAIQWQYLYRDTEFSGVFSASSVVEVADGYLIVADTDGYDPDLVWDTFILKLGFDGTISWAQSYELTAQLGTAGVWSVRTTTDGGFIVAGYTGFDCTGPGCTIDMWLMKLAADGTIQWQKSYGAAGYDEGYWAEQTDDCGFILVGATDSFGQGNGDVWVIKVDDLGEIQWQKTYGGAEVDIGHYVKQTCDGGYVVAGLPASFGAGLDDAWVLKLDATGAVQWERTYGETKTDSAMNIIEFDSGGYLLGGLTDVGPTMQDIDMFAYRLASDGTLTGTCPAGFGTASTAVVQDTTDTAVTSSVTAIVRLTNSTPPAPYRVDTAIPGTYGQKGLALDAGITTAEVCTP